MSVHVIYYQDGAKRMRPVLTREEYVELRNSIRQRAVVKAVREGDTGQKNRLLQMNYSCLPGDDGRLRGSHRASVSVGMDIDLVAPEGLDDAARRAWIEEQTAGVAERVMARREALGLLMLERSASKGFHLVFRRREGLSQEENLQWAAGLLDVRFDEGAKDITRVFFTTTADADDLLFLDDGLFDNSPAKTEVTAVPAAPAVPAVSAAPAASGAASDEGCLAFKGIAYKDIIDEWWRRNGGEPVEGERNVKLHRLAASLRSICDNRREVLMAVMPRCGLSEGELQTLVDSACKEAPRGIPKMIGAIVDDLQAQLPKDGVEEAADSDSPDPDVRMLSARMRNALPIGLKESLTGVPQAMHLPVLCSVLPLAAAYADGVEVEYCDGNRQHLGLMSIIRGEQASGKSVCKAAVDVWKRQLDDEDATARQREERWREQKKNRKANEKAPDDPKVLIRMVPVTVSCSTLLRRLKNAGGHCLYSFGEELDTLRKTNGAGSWSSKYDIYRLSFDQGEWGQDYNSDQAESGVVKVAYNWTMLGTDGALRKCFKSDNIENGLSSRILVAEMPDASFARMPRFGRRTAEDEERIQEAVRRLRAAYGPVDVPRLRKAIGEWVEKKRVEAAKDIDRVKDTYRKRAAVIAFRCGVVYHLLTGKERETRQCIDFALMMADYTLAGQMAAFGESLRTQYVEAQSGEQRRGVNHSVFDQLPPSFALDDLRGLKGDMCNETSLRKIISRWCQDRWIVKTDRNHWHKVAAEM